MEQRTIAQIFTLKKLSADDIRAEFEGGYGDDTFSLSAVKMWRKRFANRRINLEDYPSSGRPPQSDLCEAVPALIEESPFITCMRTCQKFRVATTTYV
jgi:transposase